ncbi:Protein SUPPRESSOR OF K(+) TRANSPORT GROWTH DEFECT 1 [Capsicum chinense]|nr:Protein SUPPRESSOR OF K(+) TRANSPORT GROWTH DEFECT 1 [Capsicum chinense]
MHNNFKELAVAYVKQAVEEDSTRNYAKAFSLYLKALPYFKTHLKYEKNSIIKETITQKFVEYLSRAEEIHIVVDDGGGGTTSNGDAIVASCTKSKPKNRGREGDD